MKPVLAIYDQQRYDAAGITRAATHQGSILILFDDGSHILRFADEGSFDYPQAGFRVDFVNEQLANHLPTIDPG